MTNNDSKPGFYWSSQAYYKAHVLQPEINIGLYHPDGGTTGEFRLTWYEQGHESVPRLEMFNDAWAMLAHPAFAELWQWLAYHDNDNLSDADVVFFLKAIGFTDLTMYSPEEATA
jgi:hypothetical protein